MKGLGFVKFIFSCLLLLLLGMLYWSSSLQEQDLKTMRRELKEMRAETSLLSQKLRHYHHITPTTESVNSETASQIDPKYPNLLDEDLYFSNTLPNMLGESFQPQGTLKQALIGRPSNLHPFNSFRDVSNMHNMCTVHIADLKFGQYETMAPDMAIKIEARPRADLPDIQEYWVHLRKDVYWEPLNAADFPDGFDLAPQFLKKHLVTAHDFKFFYDALMNPYIHEGKAASLRTYFSDIEEIIVMDPQTFVVRWTPHTTENDEDEQVQKIKYTALGLTGSLQPLPRFVYQYFADGQKIIEEDADPNTYRNNSVWAQNFTYHWAKNVIVSCGAFLFNGMNDEAISFTRNPHHYNPYAVLVESVKYTFKESFDAIWQDFKAGKIDLCTLSPNQLMELNSFIESAEYQTQQAEHKSIQALDYVDLSYYYIGWNQAKPFFASKKVRKAMTMALDRDRIIEQNLNKMAIPITGPFFRYSSAYDIAVSAWTYHPEEARRLLDEEGWIDMDGDGIRDKMIDGQKVPFRFKLCYYVKSLTTRVIAEYITTAFREIGVDCELCGLEIADLSRQFDDKSFDAICMGWKQGTPPEDPRQLWHSIGAKEKGSSNAIGFANDQADRLIDSLNYEYDQSRRIQQYHQLHQIIHKEAPYTFLYTPKVRLLYREYVHNLFIPREREDLIPGADIPEPNTQVIWLTK